MLEIKKETIEALPQFKKNIYWGEDNTLYKIFRDGSTRNEFYNYVNSLQVIEGLITPLDLLKDQTIYGYQLPFIENSCNIDEIFEKPGYSIDTLQVIKSIFESLHNINKHIILGDIRNSNILIKDNKAYFIDWESGKRLNSLETLSVFYRIWVKNRLIPDTIINDNLKALLISLSLYYDLNLESYFINRDFNDILIILHTIKANSNLIYYVEYLIEKAKNNDDTLELQFSEFIDFIDLPSEKEKERLVRILH